MIIDGKKITEDIKQDLKKQVEQLDQPPRLAIIYVGSDPVVDQFIKIKKRVGESVGVKVDVDRFEESITEDSLEEEIKKSALKSDGVIIQLPLPSIFSIDEILNAVPKEKDVDVLSAKATQAFSAGEQSIYPPVVGAIRELFDRHNISIEGKKIVVIGKGRLVGAPVIMWLKKKGIHPFVITKETSNIAHYLKDADVIISGAGSPGLIKPDMLKDDVVLIDAGTSEVSGTIKGDADPECASKCSLFTPVPGGMGPITVVMLFKNLITLAKRATRT